MDSLNNTTVRNPDDESSNGIGTPSDYILIAMIVAMMLCMAVCCVCLFCRSTSRNLSICGYTCEVNNSRNVSVAIDDVSELHEVVPLTPAVVDAPNLPDIENKLKSDPPPPLYNEVVSTNVLDRFRWRSKRKGTNADETLGSRKTNESVNRSKSKRSDKKSWSSRTFSRKATSKSFKESRTTDLPTTVEVDVTQDNLKRNIEECIVTIPDCSKQENALDNTNENEQSVEINNRPDKKSVGNKSKSSDAFDDEVFM